MNFYKHFFLLLICFFMNTSFAINPEEIIQKWQQCQSQSSLNSQCIALGEKALEISQLADSMEMNPQHFGIDIMQLQDKVSSMPNSEQKNNLSQELQLRLAIIGWLRSPR